MRQKDEKDFFRVEEENPTNDMFKNDISMKVEIVDDEINSLFDSEEKEKKSDEINSEKNNPDETKKTKTSDGLTVEDLGFKTNDQNGKVTVSDFIEPDILSDMYVETLEYVMTESISYFTGFDAEKYEASQKKKDRYAKICTKFFSSIETKMTPQKIFAIATAMFCVPTLVTAFKDRNEAKKEKLENMEESKSIEIPFENKIPKKDMGMINEINEKDFLKSKSKNLKIIKKDYSNTKEARDRRRFFNLSDSGVYTFEANTTPRKYIPVKNQKEKPSKSVKKLIDLGLNNTEIKDILLNKK